MRLTHFKPILALSVCLLPSSFAQLSGYVDFIANSSLIPELLSGSYDFIVVGGGNAGLTLASRLSENASNSVLVLEAGPLQLANPGIIVPGQAGSTLGTSIDWAFSTVPQINASFRSIFTPRGKILGGSSALNFLVWTRPWIADLDAWALLIGSTAWSWPSMLSFYKKSETFNPPTGNQENVTPAYTSSVHGTSGPVDLSYPPYLAPQFVGFHDALTSLGVASATDLSSGSSAGVSYAPSSIDPTTHSRVTSETAYIAPIILRPNLVVATSVQVTNINWSASKSKGLVVASGVTVVPTGGGASYVINTSGQVVLSAGAIQTPQLLELSGIGNPSILNPLGISTVVNLPGVGENLQDHAAIANVYKLQPGVESLDTLSYDPAALAAAVTDYAAGQGILTEALFPLAYVTGSSFLNNTEQRTALTLMTQKAGTISPTHQVAQLALYAAGVPIVEFLSVNVYFGNATAAPGTSYITLATCLQHPFSRGTVHITSSDPLTPPAIDPKYLSHPADSYFLAKSAAFLRKVSQAPALAPYVLSEAEPGPAVQTDADWANYVKNSVRTEYHPVGTASMQAKSLGGVVDANLLVYGTANVRVVDVSVVPLHVTSHTQSVAYAIAEKAATILSS